MCRTFNPELSQDAVEHFVRQLSQPPNSQPRLNPNLSFSKPPPNPPSPPFQPPKTNPSNSQPLQTHSTPPPPPNPPPPPPAQNPKPTNLQTLQTLTPPLPQTPPKPLQPPPNPPPNPPKPLHPPSPKPRPNPSNPPPNPPPNPPKPLKTRARLDAAASKHLSTKSGADLEAARHAVSPAVSSVFNAAAALGEAVGPLLGTWLLPHNFQLGTYAPRNLRRNASSSASSSSSFFPPTFFLVVFPFPPAACFWRINDRFLVCVFYFFHLQLLFFAGNTTSSVSGVCRTSYCSFRKFQVRQKAFGTKLDFLGQNSAGHCHLPGGLCLLHLLE